MQVGGSVNAGYYTSYQTNKSVKYCAGFTKTEDGKMTPNETTENPGFAKFVDYQEFHKAWMSQGAETAFSYTGIDTSRPFTIDGGNFHFDGDEQIRLGSGQKINSDEQINHLTSDPETIYAKQTGAVSIAETEDKGEFLGLTMVLEEGQSVTYGMRAMLSEKSTPDNPIVQVVSNLGAKKVIYSVEVNKVNPNNATQLEMFALLSYTDKMGITDGGTFGSHQQLEVYGENAGRIGYCGSLSGADVFLNEKFDWTSIMEKMVQVYKDAGIENQAEDCKALFDFFGTYTEQNEKNSKTAIDFSRFAGMSFAELISSGRGNANSIPTVSKIVNAKNPEDGKIYLTYFTERKITCLEPGGEKVWELEIFNEEQARKAETFFKNYVPDRAHVQEYYSDDALGIVSSKEFWLGLFV